VGETAGLKIVQPQTTYFIASCCELPSGGTAHHALTTGMAEMVLFGVPFLANPFSEALSPPA
jgi:hypothetical protein